MYIIQFQRRGLTRMLTKQVSVSRKNLDGKLIQEENITEQVHEERRSYNDITK